MHYSKNWVWKGISALKKMKCNNLLAEISDIFIGLTNVKSLFNKYQWQPATPGGRWGAWSVLSAQYPLLEQSAGKVPVVWEGEILQSVKCLLSKCDDLSLILRTHIRKIQVLCTVVIPMLGEAETGGSL